FLTIQAGFLVVLWVLTPFYFRGSWDYGVRWMGAGHTRMVFAEHIVGLALLSSIALIAFFKRSTSLNNFLNVALFFFWGAFPILGELP
ncbi:MAG: hypothetical protein ABIR04_01710, partial [Cypionkella sp.]